MVHLVLDGVDIEFPLYTARARSVKNRILAALPVKRRPNPAHSHDMVQVHSLRDISLSLAPGDRLALVGRNGAGKSTLLRVMSGIYEPVRGRVEIDGTLASMTDISMGMDPEANGYDNIILRGVFLGMTRGEARGLIPAIQEWTELGDHLSRPIRTYSSGMLVRLAFAVSTSIRPDILLLDEMIGAGDAHFIERAKTRMQDLIGQASIMVLASHSDDILRQFCNKALLMHEGRIALAGSVDEVLAAYQQMG